MIMRVTLTGESAPVSGAARTLDAMKIWPLLFVVFVLVGCGGGDDKPEAKSTPPAQATSAPTQEATAAAGSDAAQAVTDMFDDYRAALIARDWDRACGHLAPETTQKLQENIKSLGVTDPPSECTELMGTLYETIDKDPTAKKTIDDVTKSAKVKEIKVDGEQASISWSAQVNGVETPITQTARIIDGTWKLIDVN
jgi:hypothetical protein